MSLEKLQIDENRIKLRKSKLVTNYFKFRCKLKDNHDNFDVDITQREDELILNGRDSIIGIIGRTIKCNRSWKVRYSES